VLAQNGSRRLPAVRSGSGKRTILAACADDPNDGPALEKAGAGRNNDLAAALILRLFPDEEVEVGGRLCRKDVFRHSAYPSLWSRGQNTSSVPTRGRHDELVCRGDRLAPRGRGGLFGTLLHARVGRRADAVDARGLD